MSEILDAARQWADSTTERNAATFARALLDEHAQFAESQRALRSLLALVTRTGCYATAEDQLVIQKARAALGEAAVSPERQVVIEEWSGKRGGKP